MKLECPNSLLIEDNTVLQDTISDYVLIRTLQHSILGVRLTPTRTGFTPVSHQLISSPHVHRFVSRRSDLTVFVVEIVLYGFLSRFLDDSRVIDAVHWLVGFLSRGCNAEYPIVPIVKQVE